MLGWWLRASAAQSMLCTLSDIFFTVILLKKQKIINIAALMGAVLCSLMDL